MDNLTHTLLGAALARAGLNRMVPHAAITLMVAANLPDIDIVSGFWGNLAYLDVHRGITHSIVGVIALAFLLAWLVLLFEKRAARKKSSGTSPPGFWPMFLVYLIGTGSHLLLDFTNSYGVRPFMPFSDRWVAWDIVFIVDPVLLTILALGLVLPLLFRLISEEVGSRNKKPGRGGAITALVLVVALGVVRDWTHRSAIAKLSAFTYQGEDATAVYALPSAANPFRWHGVAETDRAYFSMEVGPNFSALNLNQARVLYKPEDGDALRAARETPTAKAFLAFARLPIYNLEKRGEDTLVTIRDLRFSWATRRRQGFITTILVSKDLQVLNQRFSFRG